MVWEYFNLRGNARGHVIDIGIENNIPCEYSFGLLYKGKSRVFASTWVKVDSCDGFFEIIGKSPYPESYLSALNDCESKCRSRGYSMQVIGLRPDYIQSGLSCGSGYGYIPDRREPVCIIDYSQIQFNKNDFL